MVDDAVAVEEGGGLLNGADDIGAAHFCAGLAHQGLLDLVADAVADREMDLLHHRRVVARRDQEMIALRAHGGASGSRESDRDQPALARLAQRSQDVRRAPRRGEREQHVATLAEAFDLARKDLLEAVIIGDRGQRRSVGGERDRGVAWPVLFVAADDFGGDVLGVARAAAIADDQKLVAAMQRRDDRGRDLLRAGKHRGVAVGAFERFERLLQMGCDRVLVQNAPSGLQLWVSWALVLIAPPSRKLAKVNAPLRGPHRARAARSRLRRRLEYRACSDGRSWCRPAGGRVGRAPLFWSGRWPQGR